MRIEPVRLPMLPMRGLVLFPKIILHFEVGRRRSMEALSAALANNRRLFLASQKDIRTEHPKAEDVYSVGVVAEVKQVLKLPEGNLRILVEGLYRARMEDCDELGDYSTATVVDYPMRRMRKSEETYAEAMVRTIRDQFEEYSGVSPRMPKELALQVLAVDDPNTLVEFIAGNLMLKIEQKQAILEQSDVVRRMEMLVQYLEGENEILTLERDIFDKVKESMNKNQREYYLREQLKVISEELGDGEDPADDIENYRRQLAALQLSDDIRARFEKEIRKLTKMQPMTPEAAVIRSYLDWCFALPWSTTTKEKIDLAKAERVLNRDHYGLEKVKDRILELLAVRRLNPDIKGQIICLVGPPGTGKTSIARSIASAIGRKYIRASLGGVRDEADIRGHRKTYIGSMPGRIISAIRNVGVKNPLFLLDEVDKLGSDFRGDPSSALLEVLDPEQNVAFVDHYIEVPFDLSDVLFIATANTTETIPGPLLDRMEVIELSSYTREEKFHIAKGYLLPKQVKQNGLSSKTFRVSDKGLYQVIDGYTREAGVRRLERTIGALCRKAARKLVSGEVEKVSVTEKNLSDLLGAIKYKPEQPNERDEVGLVTGLAWTSVGGETLPIEVCVLPGSGKIELTGSLGDVMKESARTAISCIRSRTEALQIDPDFYKNKDIHIHVPEGAVPKDGPSAGTAMATAVISALTERPVRRDVAMTGEITLRGRVLAIGGLREKSMAAYRHGVKTVIIPHENLPDLEEVAPVVREAVQFVPAQKLEDVLDVALKN